MTLIPTLYDNLIGGVSQQADTTRDQTTAEEMTNAYPSHVDGLIKRHPTEHIAKLMDLDDLPSTGVKYHAIDRGTGEQYVMVAGAFGIRAFTKDGVAVPIRTVSGIEPPWELGSTETGGPTATENYWYSLLRSKSNLILDLQGGTFPDEFSAWGLNANAVVPVATVQPVVYNVGTNYVQLDETGIPAIYEFEPRNTDGVAPGVFQDGSTTISCHLYAEANIDSDFRMALIDQTGTGEQYRAEWTISGGSVVLSFADANVRSTNTEDLGSGHYRVSMVVNRADGTNTAVGDSRLLQFSIERNAGATSGVYAWGAMFEEQTETVGDYFESSAEDVLRFLTVADTTFLLERSVVAKMADDLSPTKDPAEEGFVAVTNVNVGTVYRLSLTRSGTQYNSYVRIKVQLADNDGVCVGGSGYGTSPTNYTQANCEASPGAGTWIASGVSSPNAVHSIQEDAVISQEQLLNVLIQGLEELAITGLTTEQDGSVARLTLSSGTLDALEFSAEEGFGVAFIDEIRTFTDLPTKCRDGYVVKITGSGEGVEDDFYLKFVANDSGTTLGSGTWEETVAPGIPYVIDNLTMPVKLTRKIDDNAGTLTGTAFQVYFEYELIDWADRIVGDEETNEDPSFIDKAISDIFFHRGRLGMLADQNVILSASNDFFNYWFKSVQEVADDDVVDIQASHSKVNILRSALAFNSELLVFSDKTQFELQGNPTLTPQTASLVPKSDFESLPNVKPISLGRTVLFAFERGGFTGIRELIELGVEESFDANDITVTVPQYLSGEALSMTSSSHEDIVVIRTDGATDRVYLYKFLRAGDQRLQSAWFTYTFNDATVLGAEFIQDTLYLLMQRDGGIYLESMVITNAREDTGLTFQILLDRRIDETELTSAVFGGTNTTFTFPYTLDSNPTYQAVRRSGANAGEALTRVSQTSTTLVVEGDHSSTELYLGEQYTRTFIPTKPLLKQQARRNGFVHRALGRHVICFMEIVFTDANTFDVVITNEDRAAITETFDNGAAVLTDDKFRVVILGDARDLVIQITDDSWLPAHFVSLQFESEYNAYA